MMFTTRPTVNFLRTFILLFSLLAIAQAHPHPSKTYTTTVTVTETETTTAVSTPTSGSGSGNQSGQCNTGPIQCCQIVEPASGGLANLLLGLLGIILGDLDVDVGINCSPLSVIGIGGTNCNASPVCCENNNFNGLISIGCIPIIIEL